jgi:hypothetical protein
MRGVVQLGMLPRVSVAIHHALAQTPLDLSAKKMRAADIGRAFHCRAYWRVTGLKAEIEGAADGLRLAESSGAHLRTLRLDGTKVDG